MRPVRTRSVRLEAVEFYVKLLCSHTYGPLEECLHDVREVLSLIADQFWTDL
jgi:hypothetical protein